MDPVVGRRTGQQVVFHLMAAVALFDYLLIRSGFGSYPSLSVLLDISTTLPQLLDLPPHAQYLHHSPFGPALGSVSVVGADG